MKYPFFYLLATGPAIAGVTPPPAPQPLTIDAEWRLRPEVTENLRDFDSDVNASDDDGWLLSRARFGVAWQAIDWLKLYGQAQDSRELFSGRKHDATNGANGDDSVDLRQGYVAIGNPQTWPLVATLGRQPLDFGSRRLLADPAWSNFGRTFDAARLTWKANNDWQVDAFAGNVVQITAHELNDPDPHADLAGVYASGKIPCAQSLDAYIIYLDSSDSNVAQVKGDFWTLGSRLFKKPGKDSPWDWELEGVVQIGDTLSGPNELDLLAFGGQATIGYTFDHACKPRMSANYSYASGDVDSTDGDQNRLQPVYPSTHAMNGLLDSIGWANLHDLYLEAKVVPVKDWTVGAQLHAFFRADTDDFVYRANGSSPLRTPGGSSDERYIGTELDLYSQTRINEHFDLLVGGSVLFAGTYLADTGSSDNASTAYVQLTYTY